MINDIIENFGSKKTSLTTVINKSLRRRRDDIYFKKIDEHVEAVKKMHDTNSFSMKLLTDKIFGLSSSIHQFKEFE